MWTPAKKVLIEELLKGEYFEETEEEPEHVRTPFSEKVSRARILGTVVDKCYDERQRQCSLFLDDGTGVIEIRTPPWRSEAPDLTKYKLGDMLDVIGRVRRWGGELYISPQLVIKVEDPNLETVRILEIVRARKKLLAAGVLPRVREAPIKTVELGISDRVERLIKELDKGEGVSLEEIVDRLKVDASEVEQSIRYLQALGRIYEPQGGRYRAV